MPDARSLLLLLLTTLAAGGLAAAEPALRALQLQPTVLFANREPLAQVGWLTVDNPSGESVACEARVKIDGEARGPAQRLSLPAGVSRQDVLVPDLAQAAEVEVELLVAGQVRGRIARRWEPQRKWKVFVVKSSHEDIGYEDYLWMKQKEIADFIDLGAHLSAKTAGPVAEGARTSGGYRYWLETMLFPRYYAEERGEVALRRLIEEDVKPGLTPLAAAPSGVHTQWMDYEELVRTTYPGRRDFKDRFDLDLDTYAIVDNPSMSWSTAQVLAGAGFKYAVRLGQPFRTGGNNDYKTTGLPAVFWWEGPDARSRVLYTWRNHYGLNFWFGQTTGGYTDLTELAATNVQRELSAIQSGEKLGPYPWDAMLVPSYQDHEIPHWDNRGLRRWREVYRYPEIQIADPRDFMVYMEKNHGGTLPVLRGELNNFSADYATIDPESQGWKRRASRMLPFAEGLAAAAAIHAPGFAIPAREFERGYRRLFDFSEHSWPTSPPARDIHQFNAQWGKRLEGRRAEATARGLLARALAALAAQIPTGAGAELAVFNPLAQARTDLVFSADPLPALADPATGRPVPTQRLATGETVFLAREVPAFGYQTYAAAPTGAAPAAPATAEAGPDYLRNEFYTVRFDPATGTVVSIVDRELKRELLDQSAPHRFNQIIYVAKEAKEAKAGTTYSPAGGAKLTPHTGPLAAEMVVAFDDPQLGGASVTQTVRLYSGVKRIDVVNDLRHVGVLHSTRSADRYRHNLFFAFPFQVDDFTPRAEYAGGVVRPHTDQLRWGSHDYLAANRWVDVSNREFGVTMAVHNAAVVHFGEIRYNELSVDYKPAKSHLYSFAWSNRMAGLFTLCADDMNNRFVYSFTSHAGDWNAGAATRFGWSVASPLEARPLPAGQRGPLPAGRASLLAVDAPNVQLTVLKESSQPGRGWIARLVETEGRAVEVTLDAARFPVDAAALCDLVENDQAALAVRDGKVRVSLTPFSFATVRLFSRRPLPSAPGAVAVTGGTDSTASLRWDPVPGAVGYNVFRSVDPATPPTAHTFAGRADRAEFTDRGLHLDTAYHYRVAAVAPGNAQGTASARLEVRTASRNVSPPAPVGDFDIVREAKDRLMVCWASSPEPDVARYLVYRSEDPAFDPAGLEPLAVVTPAGFYLQHYRDTGLTPGRTYYYRVLPEDWAGNRQPLSPVAAGTTPKESP